MPLLSIYTRQQNQLGNQTSFFSVTPSDFQMDYGDPDIPFDAKHNLDMGGTILENGNLDQIPVYCDLSDYLEWNIFGDFVRNFLSKGRPAVLVALKGEINDIREDIKTSQNLSGGLENPEAPYLPRGMARTTELPISPLTPEEKQVYFAHYLNRVVLDNNLHISKNVCRYFVQETTRRFSHEHVFFKTFELMERIIVLTQEANQRFISYKTVSKVLNQMAPLHNRTKALANMDTRLKKKIFGQDEAIEICYDTILSTLDDEKRLKPTVLAFFGPSGVGKTALAEEISLTMTGKQVSSINMAEYADSFKVSILTGSAKGYVDSEEDGLLAKIVKENKNAVILLDEFEKAHPQVQRLFLGIFDKGSLYDNHAGQIDMSKTTIIITSNAGVVSETKIGFNEATRPTYTADINLIQQAFPHELLGRIDAKIFFKPLSQKALDKVVDKFMLMLKPRFDSLGIRVTLSDEARQKLVQMAQDPAEGARPLMSYIRQKIKTPIEIGILKKKIRKGDKIIVTDPEKKEMRILKKNTSFRTHHSSGHTRT